MTNYPKIGIRPIIDARRRGVRESLEDQTMGMALRVKELYEAELKYPDGSPVQVVIADSTIGRVPEAQAAAAKFKAENVGLTLSVTPCWCYGSETIDMDRTMPHAIWGFNGSERPGAVYLAAALAGHAQLASPPSASTAKRSRTPTTTPSPMQCASASSTTPRPASPSP